MRRNSRVLLSACAVAVSTVLLSISPANAETKTDPDLRQAFESWYANYGVSAKKADDLAAKFASGGTLDSASSSAKPVREVSLTKGNYRHTIDYFADGSISDTAIEQPATTTSAGTGLRPMTVGKCASTNADHYHTEFVNCDIYGTSPYLEIHFRATYVLQAGSQNDYIEEVSSPYAFASGGTADTPTARTSKSHEDANGPATAYAQTQYHSNNITVTSFTATLYLKVGNNTATSSKSSNW